MKNLINKITNKDRLIKLYGCEECKHVIYFARNPGDSLKHCKYCDSKHYIINRDSQVLDIVEELITARAFILAGSHNMNGISHNLAQALIKLIELDAESFDAFSIDESNIFSYKTVLASGDTEFDNVLRYLIQKLGTGMNELRSIELLLAICNHHKIDIWDSVKEILEGE